MGLEPRRGDALLIVDVQEDFVRGALPVPGAAAILPAINACIAGFERLGLPIYASRDWHPPAHASFRSQGGPWPTHCVQGFPGAQFAAGLRLGPEARVISKGADARREAYSAFDDTSLEPILRHARIRRVFVCGLATDYCVRATVLDALERGFQAFVIVDAVRAVAEADGRAALEAMRAAGAVELTAHELAFGEPAHG